MNLLSDERVSTANNRGGLLIDTNLLVLFVVGAVNANRIEKFKRTQRYRREDYEFPVDFIGRFGSLYTVAHVLSEVSNLTDMSGAERLLARRVLAKIITTLDEPHVPSAQASSGPPYETLGLTDAAISAVVRERKCAVLTDDFDLYYLLARQGLPIFNFTHLRAGEGLI